MNTKNECESCIFAEPYIFTKLGFCGITKKLINKFDNCEEYLQSWGICEKCGKEGLRKLQNNKKVCRYGDCNDESK